jgi:nucleotide-binding universal stress UspA family protein
MNMPLVWRKILCPIDFSPQSRRALKLAIELGDRLDAEVVLVNVYSMPAFAVSEGMVLATADTVRQLMEAVETELKQWRQAAAAEARTKITAISSMGSAAEESVRLAGESKADVIVMGTHGRGGLQHALMGSVAEKVVRRAPCPVLTVRDTEHAK